MVKQSLTSLKPRWIEDKSRNTFENGAYSATILEANNIARVIVVTEAWHMPRAVWSFARAGMTAIPAPAERTHPLAGLDWSELDADYASFARSFYALHELLGLAAYRLLYNPVAGPDRG